MTDRELERLLDDTESDRAERKQSDNDSDKIRQAICAFANDLPDHRLSGILFIGANDDGRPVGAPITDSLLLNIASIRSEGSILPIPSMTVQKRKLKGHDMAVIEVLPSDAPPVRFKGTVWVRVGPRRAIATPDDERRLSEKRRSRDLPADIQPRVSAPMDALDEASFRRDYIPSAVTQQVIEQNNRPLELQLMAAKFAHPGSITCPTVLGLLTIGKNPTEWIPGAYVQYLRIDGTALGDPVKSSREIRGPLAGLLLEADELIKLNIETAIDVKSAPVEIRKPDYPLAALQQIMRNAILHRSYENTNAPIHLYWFKDRVEIHSPGGPYGQVNRDNFGKPGVYDYRNPNLAAVMKELGFVQRFGMGIELARKELKSNGNPPLEFQVEMSHVVAILRGIT